jgi:hypothetical protein
MVDWLIALVIGATLGLLLGIKIAHDSHKKQPVKGGLPAQVFHYLACSGMTSVAPFVIAGLVVGLSAWTMLATGVGLLALTFVFLMIDVVFERSARTPSAAR